MEAAPARAPRSRERRERSVIRSLFPDRGPLSSAPGAEVSSLDDPVLRQTRLNGLHEGAGVPRAKEAAGGGAEPDQAAADRLRAASPLGQGGRRPAAGRAQAAGGGRRSLRGKADRLAR